MYVHRFWEVLRTHYNLNTLFHCDCTTCHSSDRKYGQVCALRILSVGNAHCTRTYTIPDCLLHAYMYNLHAYMYNCSLHRGMHTSIKVHYAYTLTCKPKFLYTCKVIHTCTYLCTYIQCHTYMYSCVLCAYTCSNIPTYNVIQTCIQAYMYIHQHVHPCYPKRTHAHSLTYRHSCTLKRTIRTIERTVNRRWSWPHSSPCVVHCTPISARLWCCRLSFDLLILLFAEPEQRHTTHPADPYIPAFYPRIDRLYSSVRYRESTRRMPMRLP